MQVINLSKQWLLHTLALISAPVCPVCRLPADQHALPILCSACMPKLKPRSRCLKCGRLLNLVPTRHYFACRQCRREHYYFEKMATLASYQNQWKELIIQLKHHPAAFVHYQLAHRMVRLLKQMKIKHELDAIAAVPLRSSRSGTAMVRIAKLTARLANLPFMSPLRYTRATKQQHLLGRKERLSNMRHSMVASYQPIIPNVIAVIDDVFTTGATLNECSRALLSGGAKTIYGLTLARGIIDDDNHSHTSA